MKLWGRNKKAERELPSFIKAGLIRFNERLIKIAKYLQEKTNRYSVKKKKFLLLLFLIVFIEESTIVTLQSIKQKSTTSIAVTRIKSIPVESNETTAPFITKTEFLKVQRFKSYIDSLNATAQGKKIKDSLLHNRPHLMDSVNFLVNLYLEQSKTSVK
jgi:hypothetical protein